MVLIAGRSLAGGDAMMLAGKLAEISIDPGGQAPYPLSGLSLGDGKAGLGEV